MAGNAIPSARRKAALPGWLTVALMLIAHGSGNAGAQSLYKYQADDGSWVFTDKLPDDTLNVEVRALPKGTVPPSVQVFTQVRDRQLQFVAHNEFPVAFELVLALDSLTDVELPPSDVELRWVLEPDSETILLELAAAADNVVPQAKFRFIALPGDPSGRHEPESPYRAPFAVARNYPITQAHPMADTHRTPDSRYAVDIAMPIGTDIYAARSGIVFEVASTNFRGGVDAEEFASAANLVRIMHDDGTHAVYAHLNWNTIRVRPGDRVERGEYIADSGNTGFSSGPHLHFAVLQNLGLRIESVPVTFEGPSNAEIVPAAGNVLSAY